MKNLFISEGTCPKCKSDKVTYFTGEITGNGNFAYKCQCENCGEQYEEIYEMQFIGVNVNGEFEENKGSKQMKYLIIDGNNMDDDVFCKDENELRDFTEEMLHNYYEIDSDCEYGNPIDDMLRMVDNEKLPSLIENYNYCVFDNEQTYSGNNFEAIANAILGAYIQAKSKGYNLTMYENSFDFIAELDDTRYDSIWYDGAIFELEKGDLYITFKAVGDIDYTILDKDGNETDKKFDDFNGDKDLYHNTDYTINFNHNNWFEIEIIKDSEIYSDVSEKNIYESLQGIKDIIDWAESIVC